MHTDPSENGGLFVGRRPGTGPLRFRTLPQRAGEVRQRLDNSVASLMFAAITLLCLLCWGPIPIACLWLGSQADYLSGNVSLGILVSFAALFALLFGALALMRNIDHAWILVRRAAGHDQRTGILGRVFATTAVLCALAFALWFLILHGPGTGLVAHGGEV